MAATDVTRGGVRAEANGSLVGRAARRLATETKQAFKTTEFWAMVGLVVAILVSAAVINGGDNGTDEFIAKQAWLYVSILGRATSSRVAWPSPAAASLTPRISASSRSDRYSEGWGRSGSVDPETPFARPGRRTRIDEHL